MLNLASKRNSPDRSTKVRGCAHKALPQLVNTGFQVLFHSPPGVLFTFPSQYVRRKKKSEAARKRKY